MENVKYRFKEYSRVSSFVNSSDTNMKIYRELNGKDFFLKEHPFGGYRAMDIHGERIGSGRRYDFTEMEVSTYLEIVGETKDSLDCTISYLHNWAVRHALTNLPVEKVAAMYKIFTQ